MITDLPKPSMPCEYLSPFSQETTICVTHLDFTTIGHDILEAEERRQHAFDVGNELRVAIVKAWSHLEHPSDDTKDCSAELDRLVALVLQRQEELEPMGSVVREANLSARLQEYAALASYTHFLHTGTLLPPPPSSSTPLLSKLTDEEYLGGAVLSLLSHDIPRYAVGRATLRDADSIVMARNMAREAEVLLGRFDFRNGGLRRLYDGVKYCVRTLETLLYELSVTENDRETTCSKKDEPDKKKHKLHTVPFATNRLPTAQIEQLRQRMETRDELREYIIKRCRDAQKLAKRVIYAVHRRHTDVKENLQNDGRICAEKLLDECETIIQNDLMPVVTKEPTLRLGCYSAVMEEYVEARLFHAWNYQCPDENHNTSSSIIGGKLLVPSQFPIPIAIEEYLGGLCDLSGEVGRIAVRRGTDRDTMGVQICLRTNRNVLSALQALPRFPSSGGIGKKMDPLRRSVEKLERMLYELSLVENMGRNRTHFLADSVRVVGGIGNEEGNLISS